MHRTILCVLFLATSSALASGSPLLDSTSTTATAPAITGVVLDSTGAAVPAAEVTVSAPSGRRAVALTDAAGRFDIPVAGSGPFVIAVLVPGFDPAVQADVTAGSQVTVTLVPAAVQERVDVVSPARSATITSTATRTATPLLQVPQTIDVVGAAVLEEQAATSMGDALRNVAGVNSNLGEGRRDQFLIRGFSALTDTLLDGTRDDAPYYRDVATVDRIEVVKGPAAALFGRGSSGGVINRVLKSATGGSPIAEAAISVGNQGTRRVTGDIGRPLSGSLSFRTAAAAEDSTSFRDGFYLRRVTAAPSLLWTGTATTVLTQIEVLDDHRMPDRGIPSVDGHPADVRIGQGYGYTAEDFIDTSVISGSVRVERRFAANWLVRQVARLGTYDTSFSNTAPSGTSFTAAGWRVSRQQYNAEQSQRNLFSQTEAMFSHRVGGVNHLLLTGVELGSQGRNTVRFNGTALPVALHEPVLTRPAYSSVAATYNRFSGSTVAAYAQDQISIGARWKALVGVRGDRYDQRLDDRRPDNIDLSRVDVTWSPRAGAVFQPTRHTSLYATVSRSFQPSGEGLSLAVNAAELKPEVSRNIEGGAKAELFGRRASATISVFQLDRTNIKTTDPIDPTRLVLVGRQRTSGVEVSFDGQLTERVRAQAGYAFLDAAVLRSNSVISGVPIEGNRPALVPRHGANLWLHVRATSRLSFAGGVTGTGLRYTSNDNLVALPAYTRADAAVTYDAGPVELALNARNLLGASYYETAGSNFQIFPGSPRDLVLTLRIGR